MNSFPGMGGTAQFAPLANDSLRDLRSKAEGMLEHLRENEAFLRKFPTGAVDQRLALWQPLASLLARARSRPDLAMDARLEAQRVWAEETRFSALFIVTMCVHARSGSARRRFADYPEQLEALLEMLEDKRPAAMSVLPLDELAQLRNGGFLRSGE